MVAPTPSSGPAASTRTKAAQAAQALADAEAARAAEAAKVAEAAKAHQGRPPKGNRNEEAIPNNDDILKGLDEEFDDETSYADEQGDDPVDSPKMPHLHDPDTQAMIDAAINKFLGERKDELQQYVQEEIAQGVKHRSKPIAPKLNRRDSSSHVEILGAKERNAQPAKNREWPSQIRGGNPPRRNQRWEADNQIPGGSPPRRNQHRGIDEAEVEEFDIFSRIRTPFTDHILYTALPRGYRTPSIAPFRGDTDPQNFLSQYQHHMVNQGLHLDSYLCKVFPELLLDNAREWFDRLPPRSIGSYGALIDAFERRFAQKKAPRVTPSQLLSMKQEPDEPIGDFIARFHQERLKVEDLAPTVLIEAFKHALSNKPLFRKIADKDPQQEAELWRIVDRFARVSAEEKRKGELERGTSSRKKKDNDRGNNERGDRGQSKRSVFDRINRGSVQSRLGPRQETDRRNLTPLNKSRTEIYALHSNLFDTPQPLTGGKRRSKNKFCEFHNDHGHDTEECWNLAADIERLVQDGSLKKYQFGVRRPQNKGKRKTESGKQACGTQSGKRPKLEDSDDDEDDQPQAEHRTDGIVTAISGLPVGATKSSLKADARRPPQGEPVNKRLKKEETITFSNEDPIPDMMPHQDAVVIEACVANKLVQRVMIDSGASVSVLFKRCFSQLEVGSVQLKPAPVPLRGFSQEESRTEGIINLALTVGKYPKSTTHALEFFVVDAPSSPYNIILGRDWFVKTKAVVSVYHLTVKIPSRNGTIVLKGDQRKAKECMQIALRGAPQAALA